MVLLMNVFFVNKDVKRNFCKNKIILKFIMIIFKIPGKLNGEYIVSFGYERLKMTLII